MTGVLSELKRDSSQLELKFVEDGRLRDLLVSIKSLGQLKVNRVKHLSSPDRTAKHQSQTPAKQVKKQIAYQVDGKIKITPQHSIIT